MSRRWLFALGLGVAGFVACGGPKPAVTPETSSSTTTPTETTKSALSLPGECVDPIADGNHHDPTRPFDKHVQLDVKSEDLDGDGVVDIFVKPGWSCGVRCYRSIYIARGKCGHYVGTFLSTDDYGSLPEITGGLHDLQMMPGQPEPDGDVHCYREVVKFNGTAYKASKHRECKCDAPNMCNASWTEGGIETEQ